MLVLRRKAGEAIVLNGVITIHVLAVEGERVKLGISAPPEVVIVRSELLENQGSMPASPAQSGPYWSNREATRPPRDRGGPAGGEPRPNPPSAYPGQEPPQDTAPAGGEWNGSAPARTTPAPLYSGPGRDS
jgi:carbon storage regulator